MKESAQNTQGNMKSLLAWGLAFGFGFGFFLQKGGLGDYQVLMGQLLPVDWTVVRVMGSAAATGILGVWLLSRAGLVEIQVKPVHLTGNIIGGLLFGAGFGLSAYCPGTNLVALAQGNWDALLVVLGLLIGSQLFAEFSAKLMRHSAEAGTEKVTALESSTLPRGLVAVISSALIVAGLLLVSFLTP